MTHVRKSNASVNEKENRRIGLAAKLSIVLIVAAISTATIVAVWGFQFYLPQKELESLKQSRTLMMFTVLAGRSIKESQDLSGSTMAPGLFAVGAVAFENPAVDYVGLYNDKGQLIWQRSRGSDMELPGFDTSQLPQQGNNVRFLPFSEDQNPDLKNVYMEGEAKPAGRKSLSDVRRAINFNIGGHRYVEMVMPWSTDKAQDLVFLRQIVNLSYVRGQLWQELKLVIFMVLATTIVVIVGVTHYVRRLLSPLAVLEAAAAKVAAGESVDEISITRMDEIGELTDHFNTMRAALVRFRVKFLEQRSNFERKVAERTKELRASNKKTKALMLKAVKAQHGAEDASRAKSEFLATMSHEIRTPLNGVLGMAEIMEHTDLDTAQREYLQIISQSGRTLLDLINDILDFSKIEAGQLDFNFSDFDLRGLIEEVGASFAERAQKKNVEMVCSVPPDMNLIVNSDVVRIRQVLSNLVSNAVKFTEHGIIKLSVELLERKEDKAHLRFEVRDTGIGISDDMLEQIFQSFSQADGSTTRKYGGSGLGLAIVKQIVELAGGLVSVDSKPGLGTVFNVDLWVDARELDAGEFEVIVKEMPNLKVLVVDDLSVNREIVVNQLKIWGVDCHEAASGAEALRLLNIAVGTGKPYDIGLLDYHMPEMDGLQLATAISDSPELTGLPMIMLSSVHNLADRKALEKKGIMSYLTKPVRQTDLFNALVTLAGDVVKKDSGKPEKPDASHRALDLKILVAEDNIVNQKVACAVFNWLGVDITMANNGEEALKLRKECDFDMIFMDCQMPVMDGYQATGSIRQWEQTAPGMHPIPIIALTANAIEGDREKCLEAGMDDYLSKPFNGDQIREKIERWSNGSGADPINDLEDTSLATSVIRKLSGDSDMPSLNTETLTNGQSKGRSLEEVVLEDSASAQLTQVEVEEAEAGNVYMLKRKPEESLIDFSLLDSYKELQAPGDPDLRVILIETYLQEAPGIIKRNVDAAEVSNAVEIADTAHALKSSSANVGAVVMAQLSKEIEADAKGGKLNDIGKRVAELQAIYKQTEEQYREHFRLQAN